MPKLIIFLEEHETLALKTLADYHYRNLQAQAAFMLRKELEKKKLLPLRNEHLAISDKESKKNET